ESIALEGHEGGVTHASFNGDGTQVVTAAMHDPFTGSGGGTVRVWDLNSGESIALEGHEGGVTHASFNGDGTQVVTAARDRTARVWDLNSGESITLEGHQGVVWHASFNGDDTQVVTASGDNTLRVWDLKGRQLAIFEDDLSNLLKPDGYFVPSILSPDGQRIAAVQDGKVKFHDIPTLTELLDWGCQWLDNYLKYGPVTDADRAACNLPPRDDAPQPDTVSSAHTSVTLAVSPFVSDMVHSAIVDPSFFTGAPQTDA
ncbi:MAG: hypothetical protein AAFX51_04100, partial [Cyanobacteria bacterium J06636_28]